MTSRAIMVAVGSNSCSSSRRFASVSALNVVTPVALPPGRFRLATSPAATGSVPVANTIGIFVVAALAANAPRVVPSAVITVTCRLTKSPAKAGSRSFFPSAQRYSISTLLPSTYPASLKPRRNALIRSADRSSEFHAQKPNHWHVGLLTPPTSGPRHRRAANKRDELPSPHSFSPSGQGPHP